MNKNNNFNRNNSIDLPWTVYENKTNNTVNNKETNKINNDNINESQKNLYGGSIYY